MWHSDDCDSERRHDTIVEKKTDTTTDMRQDEQKKIDRSNHNSIPNKAT
jgi:hypothetical protein